MLPFQLPYHFSWNCVHCGARNPKGNSYCPQCSYVPGRLSWSCPLCTLINDKTHRRCTLDICSGRRPRYLGDVHHAHSASHPAELTMSQTSWASSSTIPSITDDVEPPETTMELEECENEWRPPTGSTYFQAKCLIAGWLRNEASCSYQIPVDIENIIFLLFNTPSPQCWDAQLIGSGYTVSIDQKTVRKIESNEFSSCYGMDCVHSLSTNCVYQWTLTLHGHGGGRNLQYFIGISSRCNTNEALFEKCGAYTTRHRVSVYKYLYSGAEGDVRSNEGGSRDIEYGGYFGDGDTVQVRLQFFGEYTRPSLSFAVNGNDHKVAFDGLDVGFGKYYRLAATVLGFSSVSIARMDITDTA